MYQDLGVEILELFAEAQYLGRRYRRVKDIRESADIRTEHFTPQGQPIPLRGLVRLSGRGLDSGERRRLRKLGLRPKDLRAA